MKRALMLVMVYAALVAISPAYDTIIIRGRQRGEVCTNRLNMRTEYEVVEVGRGNVTAKMVQVLFQEMTAGQPLPEEAIVIVREPSFSKNPEYGSYSAVSPHAAQSILPYSPEAWADILQKTDAELADAPESLWLPVERALAIFRQRLFEFYSRPSHIYIYPPRRVPYSWALAALLVRNGAVKSLRVRISDTGKIINETPNHRPIKFFDDLEVSAEEMDQFIREYHRNTPPEKWPKLDTEPPLSMPESAAEEHGASLPRPCDSGPTP